QRLSDPTAGGSHAASGTRSVSATAHISRRAGTSRLGALRYRAGGLRPPPSLLLRHHTVLFACVVGAVLLRSESGELSRSSCGSLLRIWRRAPGHSLRQLEGRGAGPSRR